MTDQPNILVIWGDDIGISNLSCYSDGLMGYRTPNIDRIAAEGVRFTDYYGEQQLHRRGGPRSSPARTPTGPASRRSACPAPTSVCGLDPTIATALKAQGYATGQFGKNHLGDRDEFLPTMHGFDEFFGNLYHLNAEEEPENDDYPTGDEFPNFRERFGPRGVIRSSADGDGTQRIEDTGPLTRKRMETCDDEFREGCRRLHRTSERRRHAVVRLVQLDAHALPHPREAREQGERVAGGSPSTTTRCSTTTMSSATSSTSSTVSVWPRTRSSSTRPTTVRTSTPGPTRA